MKEILEISHLIYKVKDLTDAVKKFNDLGFTVEYGDEKKTNAVIYFSDRTYIEIRDNLGMNNLQKFILKIANMGEYVETTEKQNEAEDKFIRISLNTDIKNLNEIKNIYYKTLAKRCILTNVTRVDRNGNVLKCKCLFPSNANYIFYNSKFNNEKIWNTSHKNKIVGISRIIYGVDNKEFKLLNLLNTDSRIEFQNSETEIKSVDFNIDSGEKSNLYYSNGIWIKDEKQ